MSDDRKTILVVDDEPANIDVVKSVLSGTYLIQAAVNGKVALKIAAKKLPDVILLDIMMPEMDGYEVCKALKSEPNTAKIPIIFVSGKDQQSDHDKGIELGAVGYLNKPVDPSELERAIADTVG